MPDTKFSLGRREAEDLFVVAIEGVAQVAVCGDAVTQRVIEVDPEVGETGVPEKAVGGAEAGLLEEGTPAEVPGEIRRQPPARECGNDIAGVLGPPRQLLPNGKWQRRLVSSHRAKGFSSPSSV